MDANDSRRLSELLGTQKIRDARDVMLKNVTPLLDELRALKCGFEVISEERESKKAIAWITERFPMHAGGAVRWKEVPGAIVSEEPSNLNGLIAGQSIAKEQKVTLCFFLSDYPLVRCSFSSFEAAFPAMDKLHCEDWWCFDPSDSWCIENYHEGTLAFGRTDKHSTDSVI